MDIYGFKVQCISIETNKTLQADLKAFDGSFVVLSGCSLNDLFVIKCMCIYCIYTLGVK